MKWIEKTNKIKTVKREEYESKDRAKEEIKKLLMKHYQDEKYLHPKRYEYLLTNKTTFSGNSVPYLKHSSGIILTF